MSQPPIAMLGVPFDPVTPGQAVERIAGMIASRRPHHVVTPNVDFLVQARLDPELRRALVDAHLVLCDGTPLVWASRWLGNALPGRVAGADLVPELIELAAKKGWRLYFLGGAPEVAARAVALLRSRYAHLAIAGHYSPPFAPLEEMDHEDIIARVRAARPDILFVSFGCPKAEKWIARHYRRLGVPVSIGVGATIDFLAGRVKRAPVWMRQCGLEWMFRLCQEPGRLFRRYATDLFQISTGMTRQRCRLPRRPRRDQRLSVILDGDQQTITMPASLDTNLARAYAPVWSRVGRRHTAIDLRNVRFIDSTGVGLLLCLRKRLHHAGQRFVLLGPSPPVQSGLRLMHLEELFVMAADPEEARRLIQSRSTAPSSRPANRHARPVSSPEKSSAHGRGPRVHREAHLS